MAWNPFKRYTAPYGERWTPGGMQSLAAPSGKKKKKQQIKTPKKRPVPVPTKAQEYAYHVPEGGAIQIGGVDVTRMSEVERAKVRAGLQKERERVAKGGLPTAQLEALKAQGNIEELKQQILQPDLGIRETGVGEPSLAPAGRMPVTGVAGTSTLNVNGIPIQVSNEQIAINETRRQIKGLITTNIDENSSVISAEAQILFQQIVVKTAKVSGAGLIDRRLRNMEQALVNHREGSTDIIRALVSNAYEPDDAMEDVQNMVQDVAVVEQTMQVLSIHAPEVYAEMKGWEYTTRITKIRRGLLNSQQQILNFAEFGTPLPPESGNLALQLNEIQLK